VSFVVFSAKLSPANATLDRLAARNMAKRLLREMPRRHAPVSSIDCSAIHNVIRFSHGEQYERPAWIG